jgi:phosphohistidine phosphatase
VKLVIIRHGPAGDREEWEAAGRDDRLRPLTSKGRKDVRRAAAGLASLVPTLDLVVTSPLTRAVETADIVAAQYGCEIQLLESLTPESEPDRLMPWLKDQLRSGTVAVVGHEPQLSTLGAYLMTGRATSFMDLKKGGACLLELPDPPRPGDATLKWLLTADALRCLDDQAR